MNLLPLLGIYSVVLTANQESSHAYVQRVAQCCPLSQSYLCRNVCKKIASGHLVVRNLELLVETCRASEIQLWQCIKATTRWFLVSSSLKQCCSHLPGPVCQYACYFPQSPLLIKRVCDIQSQNKIHRCLGRLEVSNLCCFDTKSVACHKSCMKIFSSDDGPSAKDFQDMASCCKQATSVIKCVKKFTNSSHNDKVDLVKCCRFSHSTLCKRTCTEITSYKADAKKRFSKLIQACGFPLPQNKLWGCLLKSSAAKNEHQRPENSLRGLGLMKDHCCLQAIGKRCKEWCGKVLTNPSVLTRLDSVDMNCMDAPTESKLTLCIGDVLEPCRYGCDSKVSFCSAFKDRPMQLYRRCNLQGDDMAKTLFTSWKSGHVQYRSLKLKIKDVQSCKPDLWKAVACSIALKPCSRNSNHLLICWKDCVYLLESCLRKDSLAWQQTPRKICSILVPKSKNKECLSLTHKQKSSFPSGFSVNTPCQPTPCRSDEVCIVNKSCNSRSTNCTQAICSKGCVIPKTTVRLRGSRYLKVSYPGENGHCSQVCKCQKGRRGYMLQCMHLGCSLKRRCFTHAGIFAHGDKFRIKCNICVCDDGTLICMKKNCQIADRNNDFPCHCSSLYNPVCSINGITYTNLCFARCAGVKDHQISVGDCQNSHLCQNNTRHSKHKCIPYRPVCLEPGVNCRTRECVHGTHLDFRQSLVPSENKQEVCGMDGASYKHETHAHAAMIPIDYHGPCWIELDQIENAEAVNARNRCKSAICKVHHFEGCSPYLDPLTCCQTCGAVIRALYSKKESKENRLFIEKKPITVKDILTELQQLIYVSDCEVRGYMNTKEEIVIIIQPRQQWKSGDQIHSMKWRACHLEAERITGLYHFNSPLVTTNYFLSVVKAVKLETKVLSSNSGEMKRITYSLIFVWLVGVVSKLL